MSESDDIRERFKKPLQRPTLNLPAKRTDTPQEAPADEPAHPGGLARLLDALAKMLTPKPQAAGTDGQQAAAPAEPPVFTILVAAMNGDTGDGAASQQLFKALETIPAFKTKPLPKPFQMDNLEDPVQVAATIAAIRHAVANDNADVMVWGDVGKEGYRLRLSTSGQHDDTAFGPTTRIELPLNLGEPQVAVLHAAILAAALPVTEIQKAAIRKLLPVAAQPLETMAAKPSVQMSMPQQRSTQMVFGHIAAATALVVPPSQADAWLEKAVSAYRAAEKRLGRTDPAWEAGLIQKHVAAVLMLRAERSKEQAKTHLEEAAKAWRAASEALPKGTMTLEWAAIQTRLGATLYRLDLITGDTELLREAVQVLQGALSVYSRTETPQRWADIMHLLAQVLEVYGDQIKSAEVLKRAIDVCDSVLELRTRERTPLAWAAIQNTLGSALFMLDRHSGGTRHVADAITAFEGALEVFLANGSKGPAQVASRNLAKARKLAETQKSRHFVDPHWADE